VLASGLPEEREKGIVIEFRVLGPFEVAGEGSEVLPVRAAKERALLLLLLLHANEVVSAERLIDELWGERPPESVANVLQTYVSHLRRLLEPGTRPRENGLIVTRSPGYLLRLAPGQLDLHRFETLVAEARSSADPAAALAKLRVALALWRGPPLPEFAFERFAQAEIARLEELRLTALEERIELELELVKNGDLVSELEALIAEHPLRERLRGQLMLALYRSGRQAEALDVYQRTRHTLMDELGIEPGQALRRLEAQILNQDRALDRRPPAGRPSLVPRTRRSRAAVLAACALALAIPTGLFLSRGDGSSAVPPNSVGVIEAGTAKLAATIARRAAVRDEARCRADSLGRRDDLHVPDPLRLSLLTPLERARDRRDGQGLHRTRALAQAGLERAGNALR